MSLREVVLPDLGQDVEDANISYWLVEEGERVIAGEDLVEVTTEKATFNVQAPCSGVITEILTAEGETVQSGEALAMIDEEEETHG